MTNPLLDLEQLPNFKKIEAKHVMPAIEKVLDDARAEIAELEKLENANWLNFAEKLEDIDDKINRVWAPISHLKGVQDDDELREVYQSSLEKLTAFSSQLGQNHKLYLLYKEISESSDFVLLSNAQKRVVSNAVLDFKLSGAELIASDKQQLTEMNQQLSSLGTQFEQNLLDSTQSWSLNVTDADDLAGMPSYAIDSAQQLAQTEDRSGWTFTLQIPSYMAIMQHCANPLLREKMYKAYAMRASELSDDGLYDNAKIIDDILLLKTQKAKLLGFGSYAEYSLVKKMAKSSEKVVDFLYDLANRAKPFAQEELFQLEKFANERFSVKQLHPWDVSYYSERLREHLYDFSDEEVRAYFPADKVLYGMFEICSKLFGIHMAENQEMEAWHSDVQCFDVFDHNNESKLGSFYVDLYVRKSKRGGAWMGSCIDRRKKGTFIQLPVAFLNCNFSSPSKGNPALLSHDEVETLFHEFGHTLHHLLTQVDEASVAGINGVAWDAVELPSQFLENWCWQDEGLALISGHYQSGLPLPSILLDKMRAAKHFQSGMQTVRQVEFALFDMLLHSQDTIGTQSVQHVLDQVRKEVAVIIPPKYNRFQNSFSHIFAGGYAAGYYSYKWAEVLSSDAFSRFEEEGIFNEVVGQEFLTEILHKGGVYDANELFFAFRKREPKVDALLRHSGLDGESAAA